MCAAGKKFSLNLPLKVILTEEGASHFLSHNMKLQRFKLADNVDEYGVSLNSFSPQSLQNMILVNYISKIEISMSEFVSVRQEVMDLSKVVVYSLLYKQFDRQLFAELIQTDCVQKHNRKNPTQLIDERTKLSENPAKETEYLGWKDSSDKKFTTMELTKDSSNQYNLTVDVNGESREAGYVVKIYDDKIEKADLATEKPVYTVVIPTADLYPNLDAKETKMPQKAAAVYVNVFEGKTMNAKWHYADTYSADEIAE